MIDPINVIIADDNEVLCSLVESYFAPREDIKLVGKAFDGEEALELTVEKNPDILLLDIVMPRLDGLAVLDRLRKLNTNTKTIMLSAFGQEYVTRRAAELGAHYFLVKPFDLDTLAKRIIEFSKETERVNEIKTLSHAEALATTINILNEIGVPPHFKGNTYLVEAVSMVLGNHNILYSMTKQLYPAIGKIYNASASQVERAIRHAIEHAWLNGDIELLEKYFGSTTNLEIGRPTNSTFISRVSELVRQKVSG